MTTISRVTLVVHPGKPEAVLLAEKITEHLNASGLDLTDDSPDLVVSVGGDGTMLRAAHQAHDFDALLLGVNMGTLGYLTEIDAPDAIDALDRSRPFASTRSSWNAQRGIDWCASGYGSTTRTSPASTRTV
jgi:NAD+ kinase